MQEVRDELEKVSERVANVEKGMDLLSNQAVTHIYKLSEILEIKEDKREVELAMVKWKTAAVIFGALVSVAFLSFIVFLFWSTYVG